MQKSETIRSFFDTLRGAWGAQHWWPADSPFEVIVGAILTQNTAWTNVELALANLRSARALSPEGVRTLPLAELEALLRPAGFFRQKAARLKSFVGWLDERYQGSLGQMLSQRTPKLRVELLALNGIGPETADSILLYAGQHEIFVVDAYTRRIFERHELIDPTARYNEIRAMVEGALRNSQPAARKEARALSTPAVEPGPGPAEETVIPTVHPPSRMSESPRSSLAQTYNEFHALIVQAGKHYCQSRVARCEQCPLKEYLNGKTATGRTVKRMSGRRPKLKKRTSG